VLVGSTGIRQLILGSGRQTAVPGVSGRGGQLVTGLVAGPDADYAATIACDGSTAPRFYRIVGGRAQLMAVPGDQFLVGGAHHAWGARYPVPTTPTGSTPPGPVLTPLDGGRKLQLGSNTWLFADTEAGLIVGRPDPETAGPSQLELADAATGRRVRSLPAGTPMAATGRTLLLQGAGCQNPADPEGCLITRVDLATGRYPMAAERYPDATAVLSANQKVAAFQLGRAAPDLRFEASRLIPPSDIAILHLDTGRLDVVPDLELSPRASAGLALDPTGSTLVAGISLGSRLEVLAWQPGRPAPGLIAHVAGAFDNTRPSILFTGRSG
jgi:hypothetical protein